MILSLIICVAFFDLNAETLTVQNFQTTQETCLKIHNLLTCKIINGRYILKQSHYDDAVELFTKFLSLPPMKMEKDFNEIPFMLKLFDKTIDSFDSAFYPTNLRSFENAKKLIDVYETFAGKLASMKINNYNPTNSGFMMSIASNKTEEEDPEFQDYIKSRNEENRKERYQYAIINSQKNILINFKFNLEKLNKNDNIDEAHELYRQIYPLLMASPNIMALGFKFEAPLAVPSQN